MINFFFKGSLLIFLLVFQGPSKEEVLNRLAATLEKKLTIDGLSECAQEIKDIKFPERQQNCVINHILNLNLNNNGRFVFLVSREGFYRFFFS